MSNETTIKAKIQVSGLSELEKAKSLIESLGHSEISVGGLSKLVSELNKVTETAKKAENAIKGLGEIKSSHATNALTEGLNKASEQATKLESKLKEASNVNTGSVGNKLSEGITKASESANKLKTSLKEATTVNGSSVGLKISEGLLKANASSTKIRESIRQSNQAEQELASSAQRVASAEKEAASAVQQGTRARKEAVQSERRMSQEAKKELSYLGGSSSSKQPGKIRSALREAFGMYTLGQLGANAVMAAGEGIGNLFKGGLSYISEQQASTVSWASNARSVNQLLGRKISNRQANSFAKGMVGDVGSLAAAAGNDYKMVSDAALAFYATGAGVSTAGNKKKTLQLTKDMLNLQDAGGLNDEEMGRFIQSVAKTLDQDKFTSERLNQLKQFNPNIDNYLEKAHKKRTGEKGSVKDFTGDDLVEALHMMGMAPGVSDASKRMNQSLSGVKRSVKNGLVRMTGEFEKKVGEGLNKAFGGDGKLFSRISNWFNDDKKNKAFVNRVADGTMGVVTTAGKVGKEAYKVSKDIYDVVKPYASTFITSFADEMKNIGKGISTAYDTLKGWGKKFTDLLPKGAKGKLDDIGQTFSSMAGKATAFLVTARGLSKLPIVGKGVESAIKPLLSLTSKIPVVGKGLTGIISKITGIKPQREMSAANTMQSAANTMMSAANKMNSGSSNGDYPGGISGRTNKGGRNRPGSPIYDADGNVIDFLDGEGGTFYKDSKGRTKRPFKGKGAFSGEFNPYLNWEYKPGDKLSTRMGRYHNGRTVVATPRSNKLIARGQEILDYTQNTRVGRNGLSGRFNTIKGNTLIKLGTIGSTVASSGVGRGFSFVGRGIRSGTRAVGKYGMPGMNALFTGLDVMSVLGSTKSGSLARHKGVGGALGSGIGSTIGMTAGGALGSALGPVGTAVGSMVGGMAGGWLGDKVGSWIGGKFGGSKGGKKPKPSWNQRQQSKAEAQYAKDNFISGYNDLYKQTGQKPGLSGKKAYSMLNAASKSNSKARTAAMHYQDAMNAGDTAAMAKYQKQMQKQIKKQDASDIKSAASKVNSARKKADKAYSKAYKDAKRSLDSSAIGLSEKQKRKAARKMAKGDKEYQKAEKAASRAAKKRKSAIKKYEKETGEKYKSSKGSKKSVKGLKKLSKATKKVKGKTATVKAKTKGEKAVKKLSKSAKKVKNKNAKVTAKVKGDKKVSKLSKSMKKVKGNKKAKVTAKVKGDKKVSKLSKNMKKVKGKNATVKAKTKGEKAVKKLSKSAKKVKNKNAKVTAKVKGDKKVSKLSKSMKKVKGNKKAKVTAKVKGDKKVSKLSKNMKKVKNKKAKVKVKTSGDKKVTKLSKNMKKVKNKKAKVKVTTTGNNKVKKLSKDLKKVKNKKAKVSASVSGSGKVKSLSRSIKKVKNKKARVTASASGAGKVKSLGNSIRQVKNKKASVSAKASGAGKVKSLGNSIRQVKNKKASVSAKASGTGKVKSLSSAINAVKNKTVSVTAKVVGTGKVKALTSAINAVKGKSVNVSAKVSGTGSVRSLAAAISAVHSKHVTITATVSKSGHLATGTPGAASSFGVPALATGTPAATTNQWSSNGGTKKGVYLVNDAPGADYVEAFKTKGGLIGLFPKQRNILVPLEEGTQVLNAKETKKKFPRLEKGTKKFAMPIKFPKLAKGTPNAAKEFKTDISNSNSSVHATNHNTFNINISVNTGNTNTSPTNLANTIANAIGEKLRQQFPATEI